MKKNTDWEGRHETVLFVDVSIIYVENLKEVTEELLELINDYGKPGKYKVNQQ